MKSLLFISLLFSNATFAQDQFLEKQWAIKNKGQTYFRNISDLKRIEVQGTPGVDINYVEITEDQKKREEIVVAVIDSGLDISHPDLVGRVWFNKALCENAPNASVLPCNGRNFLENNNDLSDDIGHGTHVAGIIAANKNRIGILGASPVEVKIMPLKVMSDKVTGFTYKNKLITDIIAEAIMFAVKNKADVINMSLGWPLIIDTPVVRNAIKFAEDNNVTIVAASGNNNKDLPVYPCAYNSVVCVGSIDAQAKLSEFSNHGMIVDMLAPGDWIISTYPMNLESRTLRFKGYEVKKGSSQAAPYVAAAVANLKLISNDLTNDEVRSKLYSSSRAMRLEDAKFTKFGLLDMRKLLEESKNDIVDVIAEVKEVGEIQYEIEDQSFELKLPIKNLNKNVVSNVKVCLSVDENVLDVAQKCFLLDLEKEERKELHFVGEILNLKADSHQNMQIVINDKTTKASFVFSRKVKDFDDSFLLQEDFNNVGYVGQGRSLSRMTKVIDRFEQSSFGEYFYLDPKKQTPTHTNVELLIKKEKYEKATISLEKVNRLISIHRIDVNLDGKLDYMFYSLSKNRDELLLNFLDSDLKPVFGKKSEWKFKLSTFEGLPVENGKEKFEWLKINHPELGTILTPSIYQKYTMPEEDNSKKLATRVTGIDFHQFYLSPVIKGDGDGAIVELRLRVLDSVTRMDRIRHALDVLGAFDYKNIILLKPLGQSYQEAKNGELSSLLVREENGQKSYYKLSQTIDSYRLIPIKTNFSLENALVYDLKNLEKDQKSNYAFTYLNNRSNAQMVIFNDETLDVNAFEIKNNWDNPMLSLIASYEQKGISKILFENRYSVSLVSSDGKNLELPIYRDSSFPGQSFSETFTAFSYENKISLFINSTLIFGNRIYAMQEDAENGFKRPIALSVSIPKNCVSLGIDKNGSTSLYNYSFICNEGNNESSLKFLSFPL